MNANITNRKRLTSTPLFFWLFTHFAVILTSCTHSQNKISATEVDSTPELKAFSLTSPTFITGNAIPRLYTCDSSNISPELRWNKPPGNVKSYALIMDDPDAPMGVWVHWIVFNIPYKYTGITPQFPTDSVLKDGIRQGITSFGLFGYKGPCPPDGLHHYHFKLFALDTTFATPCATTGEKKLTALMKGHIIVESELIGIYQRKATLKQE